MTNTHSLLLAVEAVQRVADDVLELTLCATDRSPLPTWQPGAHIELLLPSGLTRQYSLCGDPAATSSYTIAVLREVNGRGGSAEIHEIADVGTQFMASQPKNNFPLESAHFYLFIGGGIGITPLLPMIDAVEQEKRQWSLVYGGRTTTSMAYVERLSRAADRVDVWVESERGYPDFAAILGAAPAGTLVYSCGPSGMLDAVRTEFGRHPQLAGLHVERFTASGEIDMAGHSFEVELHRSGEVFTVAEGQPILAEVKARVPSHPFSCEEGYCGECEARVIDGVPDHRDDYLTEEEQQSGDVMMICVSRCKGRRLVLDL